MKFFIYTLLAVTVFCSFGCHKHKQPKPDPGHVNIDGLEIHQVGGIAGLNNHFLIKDGKVMQAKNMLMNPGDTYKWDIKLPDEKYNAVKSILNNVREDLLTAANPPYTGQRYPDMMGGSIILYHNGTTHELDFGNIPDSNYSKKVAEALNVLTVQ